MALDIRFKPLIWKRYNEEQPGAGHIYEQWCEDVAASLGLTVTDVRKVIAAESALFNAHMQIETRTLAQQIAHKRGLTEELVISKIMDGLEATAEEILYFTDFEGRIHPVTGEERLYAKKNPQKDADGNWVTFKKPDFRTQQLAVREAVSVLAMQTPDWVQEQVVKQQNIQINMLPDDEVAKRLAHVEAQLSGISSAATAEISASGRTARARVSQGLPRVVDARYEDLGRAGPNGGEPDEAVPDVPVHPPRTASVRKRANGVSAKK